MFSSSSNHLKPLETLPKAAAAPLDYRRPSTSYRRRVLRTAIVIVFISIATAALKLGPPALRNYQLLALQDACEKHALPANFVVLDTDPTAAAKKIAAGTHEKVFSHSVHSAVPASVPSPAGYVFKPWRDLYNAIGPGTSRPSDAIAFLGTLTSPSGNKRLVCIDFSVIHDPDQPTPANPKPRFPNGKTIYLRWSTVRPGSLATPPVVVVPFIDSSKEGPFTQIGGMTTESMQFTVDRFHDDRCRLLVRAGTIDPHEASHVIIEVEDWEHAAAWRLHARLCDNDRLRVQPDPPQWLENLVEPKDVSPASSK